MTAQECIGTIESGNKSQERPRYERYEFTEMVIFELSSYSALNVCIHLRLTSELHYFRRHSITYVSFIIQSLVRVYSLLTLLGNNKRENILGVSFSMGRI